VLSHRLVSLLVVLIGFVCQPMVFAENRNSAVLSLSNLTAEMILDLNFEAGFRTEIVPIPYASPPPESHLSERLDRSSGDKDSGVLQLPPSSRINLSRVRALRAAGALKLAESLLVAGISEQTLLHDWLDWSRELWEIRDQRKDYDSLINSLEDALGRVDGVDQLEVLERLSLAQQKSGDFISARAGLRHLLLNIDSNPVRTARLRRLVIENYLNSGFLADAETASLRYQDEYLPDDTEWNILRAEIQIGSSQPSKAVAQLVGLQDERARLMLTLARLRENSLTPKQVIGNLNTKEMSVNEEELENLRLAIIAEAADNGNYHEIEVAMREALISRNIEMIPVFGKTTLDQLLVAYQKLATLEGNNAFLLVGNHSDWISYARELPSEKSLVARAIYVHILQVDGEHSVTDQAHNAFISSLLDDDLYRLFPALYGDSGLLGPIPSINHKLSLQLIQSALSARNYSLAALLSSRMDVPPAGLTNQRWELQIARLEIFSGDSTAGTNRLLNILSKANKLEEQQLDQLLQVVFDLQAINRHDLAIKIFEAAAHFAKTVRQKRELLFWMGESQISMGRYAHGADLFLQSAGVGGQKLDLWGQSARFRAADALVQAGLLGDAFNVYGSLLAESADEKRQLQLRQKLQSVNLLQAINSE